VTWAVSTAPVLFCHMPAPALVLLHLGLGLHAHAHPARRSTWCGGTQDTAWTLSHADTPSVHAFVTLAPLAYGWQTYSATLKALDPIPQEAAAGCPRELVSRI
jgi:hypothetical protein